MRGLLQVGLGVGVMTQGQQDQRRLFSTQLQRATESRFRAVVGAMRMPQVSGVGPQLRGFFGMLGQRLGGGLPQRGCPSGVAQL